MRTLVRCVLLLGSLAIAGCGGGDDDTPAPAAPVAGLYEGSGGSEPASKFLILDTGRYYLVYGLSSASAAPAGGVIVGDGTAGGTSFSSGNARDFDLQAKALRSGTLAGTLVPRASSSITFTDTGGSASYSGTFDAASTAGASLTALTGSYGGQLAGLHGSDASALTIDGSGALAGGASGNCTYGGIAQTHASGNVYDIRLVLGSECPNGGSTLHGHAFLSGKTLYAVVVSGDRATVMVFAGVKP